MFHSKNLSSLLPISMALAVAMSIRRPSQILSDNKDKENLLVARMETLRNWSNTHQSSSSIVFYPRTQEDVINILDSSKTVRAVGSGLSPNGLGFIQGEADARKVMLSLAEMDRIILIDKQKKQVKVQSGCTIGQLLNELKEHGLTLPNIPSITEQQIGGVVQVSAHGTGAKIAPMDEFVVDMKIVSPSLGLLHLSKSENPSLFNLAKVGLGLLGIVTEMTIQCVDSHLLKETIQVFTHDELIKEHKNIVNENKHAKYLWIPYTDEVVVITANETTFTDIQEQTEGIATLQKEREKAEQLSLQPMIELLEDIKKGQKQQGRKIATTEIDPNKVNFADMRDKLLDIDNLNPEHIVKVNKAELSYWKRLSKLSPTVIRDSTEILAFACGGQQLVWEFCFENDKEMTLDINMVKNILQIIKEEKLPAPGPIEHRFTAPSSSVMSPAYCKPNENNENRVFSWIGVIMYLTNKDQQERDQVSTNFNRYCNMISSTKIFNDANSKVHWAKLEIPDDKDDLEKLRKKIKRQYDLDAFNQAREESDKDSKLSNYWAKKLF